MNWNKTSINWILYYELDFQTIIINNQHIILSKYFKKIFGFAPRLVYINEFGILFFISKKPTQILRKKYQKELEFIRRKFTKMIYLASYPENLSELINNLFYHIKILEINCILLYKIKNDSDFSELIDINPEIIRKKKYKVNIMIKLDDKQMPYALGRKGHYIHLVNSLLWEWMGNYTIFLRS
ncbi:MAG: hypothetical protein GY870_19810 [archaeon]|nr:hypothetical protein [archaeon]